MALDTVLSVITGITGNDVSLRIITEQAVVQSKLARIKAPAEATSAVQRYVYPGNVTAHVTAEGENKTVASGVANGGYYQLLPISLIIPLSNSLTRTAKNLQDAVVSKLTQAIAEGMDREILRNADGKFASSVFAAATAASQVVTAASPTALTYAEVNSMFGFVNNGVGDQATGSVIRAGSLEALRNSETTSGYRYFVAPTENAPGELFGSRLEVVSGRVLPRTGTGSEVMMVAGNFDYLDWATMGNVEIKVSEEASVTGFNAFEQNLVLVRAELWFGFAILDNTAFAAIKE